MSINTLSTGTINPGILECGHEPSAHEAFTIGYGSDELGNRSCYDCIAVLDRNEMNRTGKATMYLSSEELIPGLKSWKVTNWPGSLVFTIGGAIKYGKHNFAGTRYDVWFSASGATWHGVQYGDNTQIVHCKRVAA